MNGRGKVGAGESQKRRREECLLGGNGRALPSFARRRCASSIADLHGLTDWCVTPSRLSAVAERWLFSGRACWWLGQGTIGCSAKCGHLWAPDLLQLFST